MNPNVLRFLAIVQLAYPYVSGTAGDPVDRGVVCLVMFFALMAFAQAYEKDSSLERVKAELHEMRRKGRNLRPGASVHEFRDIFR